MNLRIRTLVLTASCLVPFGCRRNSDNFPLDSRTEWRYAITRDLGVDTVTRYIDGTVDLDGKSYTALATRWPDGSVTRMLYRRDPQGVFARADGAGSTAVEALLVPHDMTPGQSWMMPVGGGQTVLASVGETEPFVAPSGRYSGCHRVAWTESGSANYVLLCPGVGVVKARYGANEELLIGSGPRADGQGAQPADARQASGTAARACGNDAQSNAHVAWTESDWRLALPADLLQELARYKPGFTPYPASSFPVELRDSLDRWYPAESRNCASPYAVLADFNQDGAVDAAIYGVQGDQAMLVGVLSTPAGWEFADLDPGQGTGSGWRLGLVPQGTALPPGPGTPARMPTMGFVVNGLVWGPTYYYASGLRWESVASPGD